MKVTKEQLMSLIGESTYNNLKEMAQLKQRRLHGAGAGLQKVTEPQKTKFQKIFVNNQRQENEPLLVYGLTKETKNNPKYTHVGWRIFSRFDLFFIGNKGEINEFLGANRMEVQQILQESGLDISNVRWTASELPDTDVRRAPFSVEPMPGYEDIGSTMTPDTRYKDKPITDPELGLEDDVTQIPNKAAERIVRDLSFMRDDGKTVPKEPGLYTMIKSVFGGQELMEHMAKLGLPTIHANEREYLNRHNKDNGNEKFEYSTHTIHLYKTPDDWYRSMLSRIKGTETPQELIDRDSHMRYQFNKIYRNWESSRRAEKKTDARLTPVYKLEARDYTNNEYEVAIKSTLTVKGVMSPDKTSYTWTVSYLTSWGKRLPEQYRIDGGLKPDTDVASTKTCPIVPQEWSDLKVITSDETIRQCLMDALSEVADKIMAVKPATMIRKALATQGQIDVTNPNPPQQGPVNEDKIDRIVDRIFNQLG
jgi:hypothetical protein